MHTTLTFNTAVDTLKAELGEDADPIIKALVKAYAQLNGDPWTFARKEAPDASEGDFVLVFYPGYQLTYRIEAEFHGEATIVRQHVYLKNILRQN